MAKFVRIPHLGKQVRLVPRDSLRRRRPCRTLCVPFHLKGVWAASPLPAPPMVQDWTRGNTLSFPILGNDQYGDCYYAEMCHHSQTMTGNAGSEDTFNTADVVKAYLALSGGDNGLSTDMAMGEWKKGLVGGPHRILDDMAVNPKDLAAMQLAINLFGGVAFTLGIPDPWLSNPKPGDIWDSGSGVQADDNNGHAVLLNGYGPKGFTLQTWGFNPPVTITPAGVAVCDPEATVVFSLDWFDATGRAPNGYSYDQLAQWWQQLGGNALPPFTPPAPVPPPGPVPTPPPVPNPSAFTLNFAHGLKKGWPYWFRAPADYPAGVYTVQRVSSGLVREAAAYLPHASGQTGQPRLTLSGIIQFIESLVAQYGPSVLPLVEGWVNSLPLAAWEKQVIDQVLSNLLNPTGP